MKLLDSTRGAIPFAALAIFLVVILVILFALPGVLVFAKFLFSSAPSIGPIGIAFIVIIVLLVLRRYAYGQG